MGPSPVDFTEFYLESRDACLRLAGLAGVAAVACAVTLAVTLPVTAQPGGGPPQAQLAAWTVVGQPCRQNAFTIRFRQGGA